MQNTENEKLTWEAPRLITSSLDNTETGTTPGGTEALHTPGSRTFYS